MTEPQEELFNDEDQGSSSHSFSSTDDQHVSDDHAPINGSTALLESEDEIEEENISESESEYEEEKPKRTSGKKLRRSKKLKVSQFIDDEAELSGDDVVSEDELELSDDDQLDPDLVDHEAKDLGSEEEEEVRRIYHKQLETEDRKQLLLLQEKLEENEIAIGQRRRRKFRWQTKELMETSLKRHYDPDDDDSQEGSDDEEDDFNYSELNPRLRRPGSIVIGSTKISNSTSHLLDPYEEDDDQSQGTNLSSGRGHFKSGALNAAAPSTMSDDSNSNTMSSRLTSRSRTTNSSLASDMNRYLYRDKEVVEALSTRETIITTREEKDRVIQRELKRVLTSTSIFDQLYS